MSASREKKARQELNESGYVDPRKAREAEEKAKERRSTRIYTAVIVAFVLLGVVLFASGRIQASNEAKETARIGAESAVTIDGEDFSVNDVAYYYGSIYNTFANNGSSFGFDSSKSAREQQYTEGKTWHDYFLESALDYMKESVAVAHAAEAAGFDGAEQMDAAEQSNLSMVDLYASYSGATRAQYLTAMFGKYMTEEAFVRCVRRDALASAYQQSYSDSLTYSAADLQAAYDEDPKLGDIGILSSLDPVALDQACLDLVYASDDPGKGDLIKRIESRNGVHTIEAAAALGVGSREYELITL